MEEKTAKALVRAVNNLAKKVDMHCDFVLHQTRIMAALNGFDIDEEGCLVDIGCDCDNCQCKQEVKLNNFLT